jgi:periplasmic copper chaperone A
MLKFAAVLLLAVAIAPPAAQAHSHKRKGLEIIHPWTFATATAGATVAVCMKIKNRSGSTERLIGASTTAATRTELLEPAGDGAPGATKPAAAILIAPGADTTLERNGAHLRLSGVKKPLGAYESFKLTLVFEKAGRVTVDVAVEEPEEERAKR